MTYQLSGNGDVVFTGAIALDGAWFTVELKRHEYFDFSGFDLFIAGGLVKRFATFAHAKRYMRELEIVKEA
jgi:hypothetical protein